MLSKQTNESHTFTEYLKLWKYVQEQSYTNKTLLFHYLFCIELNQLCSNNTIRNAKKQNHVFGETPSILDIKINLMLNRTPVTYLKVLFLFLKHVPTLSTNS